MYSHRNGETEPPTEAGYYFFRGRKMRHPRRTSVGAMVRVWQGDGEMRTQLRTCSPCSVDEMVGRWWGPVTPPWEDA